MLSPKKAIKMIPEVELENLESLIGFMRMMKEIRKEPGEEFKYCCIEDFVMMNGRAFPPRDCPTYIKKGATKKCFQNATRLVHENRSYRYVEGYALGGCFPILHAWVIDSRNRVIDNTWPTHGGAYFGVIFSTRYLSEILLSSGRYGVLDNFKQRYPLLREGMKRAKSQKKGRKSNAKIRRGS